jgi:hypothetical protein
MTTGMSVCAIDHCLDNGSPDLHDLHPNVKKAAMDEMLALKQVNDMGPWNGFYYLSEWKLKLETQTLMNKYVLPDGPPPLSWLTKNFYQFNKENGIDIDGYLRADREHERKHAELAEKALKEDDPAKECERMVDNDKAKLKDRMKTIILASERAIWDKSCDPLAVNWQGHVYALRDDTDTWRPLNTHTIGVPGGKW